LNFNVEKTTKLYYYIDMKQKNFKIKPGCQEFIKFYSLKNQNVHDYEIINMCIQEVMNKNQEFQNYLKNKGKISC
jgi:hypothetical protein